MIDPHWQLVDLDPRTWRNIGRFISPGQYIRAGNPDEHALYVLHDDGRFLNAVDTESGPRRDLGIERVNDPTGLAERIDESRRMGAGPRDRPPSPRRRLQPAPRQHHGAS